VTIGARLGGQAEDKVLALGHMALHVTKVPKKRASAHFFPNVGFLPYY
jgi:hypothetical protein